MSVLYLAVTMTTTNFNWDSHPTHVKKMLQYLLISRDMSDVTLVCDDKKQLKAHRVILSACSPTLKDIICEIPSNNPVIYLKGIESLELEAILQFMYLGQTSIDQERIIDFMEVAKSFEIEELSNLEDNKINTKDLKNMEQEEMSVGQEEELFESDDNDEIDGEENMFKKPREKTIEAIPSVNPSKPSVQEINPPFEQSLEDNNYETLDGKEISIGSPEKEILEHTPSTNLSRSPALEMNSYFDKTNVQRNISNPILLRNDDYSRFILGNNSEEIQPDISIKVKTISSDDLMRVNKAIQEKNEDVVVMESFPVQNVPSLDPSKTGQIPSRVKSYDTSKYKYKCQMCDFRAVSKSARAIHIQTVHEGIRYSCDRCDYSASLKGNLKVHIQAIHEGIKHPCELCNYQATQKASLSAHKKTKHFMHYYGNQIAQK